MRRNRTYPTFTAVVEVCLIVAVVSYLCNSSCVALFFPSIFFIPDMKRCSHCASVHDVSVDERPTVSTSINSLPPLTIKVGVQLDF